MKYVVMVYMENCWDSFTCEYDGILFDTEKKAFNHSLEVERDMRTGHNMGYDYFCVYVKEVEA